MSKKITRPHASSSGRHLSTKEKEERRAKAIEQIKLLLANEPMSAADVGDELGLHRSTAFAHLHHMAGLRLAHRSGQKDDRRRELWVLGADLLMPTDPQSEQGFVAKHLTVPAKQLGMWRDPLVEAMFGAAALGAQAC